MASSKREQIVRFWKQGEPFVWMTAGTLAMMLMATAVLLLVVLVKGLVVFWPSDLEEVKFKERVVEGAWAGERLVGERIEQDKNPDTGVVSVKYKTGNREHAGFDFIWVREDNIAGVSRPDMAVAVERMKGGNFYGYLRRIDAPNLQYLPGNDMFKDMLQLVDVVKEKRESETSVSRARIMELSNELNVLEEDILKQRYYRQQLDGDDVHGRSEALKAINKNIADLEAEKERLKGESDKLNHEVALKVAKLRENCVLFETSDNAEVRIELLDIVRAYRPNNMGILAKGWYYAGRLWELFFDEPRESNTEGGLFPAIFGTVMLIFIMAVLCFPLGVMAGVYLGEYAKEGVLVKMVRVAVNNLAGIPSIVYGIFGLGFFVYTIGAQIDSLFFPYLKLGGRQWLGTGGILWASLTLGLLTIPVVIVSTEEALRTIPRSIKEGSLALGATKFQTMCRVLLPMASPGIMTGFVLAMARAAGEVAPLMITGVVKMAPALPMDWEAPFVHVERKFMHLGFHIYDVGFQSPNVEAAKPMVYVTTLLLLLIVVMMSGLAIWLRNRMRKRYQIRSI